MHTFRQLCMKRRVWCSMVAWTLPFLLHATPDPPQFLLCGIRRQRRLAWKQRWRLLFCCQQLCSRWCVCMHLHLPVYDCLHCKRAAIISSLLCASVSMRLESLYASCIAANNAAAAAAAAAASNGGSAAAAAAAAASAGLLLCQRLFDSMALKHGLRSDVL